MLSLTKLMIFIYAKGAQRFHYFWLHNVFFYEIRPPVNSRYSYFLQCFCSASMHTASLACFHMSVWLSIY